MLLTVKYLSQEIDFNTVKPIHSKISAIQNILSRKLKLELMRFIGSMNLYSKINDGLQINLKHLIALFRNNVEFHWNIELEKTFKQNKTSLTKAVNLTLPNKNRIYLFTVNSFLIGIDCFLLHLNNKGKLAGTSNNSRIFTNNEQKVSITHRELLGLAFSATRNEHIIIGSDHIIIALNDHKKTLRFFTTQGKLSPTFVHCANVFFQLLKSSHLSHERKNSFRSWYDKPFTYSRSTATESIKTQTITSAIFFGTLKYDGRINHSQNLVKQEPVLPSKKFECQ